MRRFALLGSDHRALFLLTFSLISLAVTGQDRPQGVYANAADWSFGIVGREFQPSVRKVIHKKEGYDLYWFDDERGNQIGVGHWGLVRGDTLYLRYERSRFIRALEQGRFCYFKGPPFVSDTQHEEISYITQQFGGIMGALKNADVKAQVKDKIHYVLNTRNGKVYPLSVGRMRILLAEHPVLLSAFEREPVPNKINVMLDYLRRANVTE